MILIGFRESENYFIELCKFVEKMFGKEVFDKFEVIIDDLEWVGKIFKLKMVEVCEYCKS